LTNYLYHTESEQFLKILDSHFLVVTVVGYPSDGLSPGYDLRIIELSSKEEIRNDIQELYAKEIAKA